MKKYCKEHNIKKDDVIDTYEIFEFYQVVFGKIDELIKNLFKT